MSPIRTYVDASVLIAAYKANEPFHELAKQALLDPNRYFVSSPFLKLEVLPKAVSNGDILEETFYKNFFEIVIEWVSDLDKIVSLAIVQMSQRNIKSLDALHIASALLLNADEIITTENRNNRLARAIGIKVTSLR
jgi:predicted nucleic acid-binding protein